MTTRFSAVFIWTVVAIATLLTGCQEGPQIYPVSGTVKFADGSIPHGEVAVIRFEPVAGSSAAGETKAAAGDIKPDGSFKLTTLNPDDGAFAGEYKVVFSVFKTYLGREPLIDAKYTTAETTPFTATIKAGSTGPFEYTLDKAP